MANLTGQNIKDTYQQLVTLGSGTTITNGTGSQITDLAVTASWASNAVTASYALNAGVTVDTGSLMVTGSVSGNVLTFTKGDGSAFNLTVATGSIPATASYALKAGDADELGGELPAYYASAASVSSLSGSLSTRLTSDEGNIATAVSASNANAANIVTLNNTLATTVVTASANLNTITFTKADASTFSVTVSQSGSVATASLALDAERLGGQLPAHYATATSVSNLSSSLQSRLTSDEANISSLQGSVASLNTATGSLQSQIFANDSEIGSLTAATSSYALKTEVSGAFASVSSSFASRLTTDEAIITSLVAATGSYAKTNTNNSFTGTQTFDNIAVNGTASIAYLQAVTGSAKIIGDAYIILNNDTPAERYAGIKVIDSGSSAVTASFLYDGQTNDWFYEYQNGDPTNHGVVLFGPEYGTIGVPSYPTANQIQKGTGGHHLTGSNITDDGSVVSIGSRVNVTGAVTASAGFSGNLDGNAATATSATTATSASHAVNADNATSASFATTALSASYAPAGPASNLQAVLTAGNTANTDLDITDSTSTRIRLQANGRVLAMQSLDDSGTTRIEFQDSSEINIAELSYTPTSGDFDIRAANKLNLQNLTYPNGDGTSGQALTTNGSGQLGFSSTVPSSSYAAFALTASYALNGGGGAGEATQESGNLLFENIYGEIYGSAASPVTGNLTIDGSSVKLDGAVAVVFHTGSTEPTVSGGNIVKKTGNYSSTALNVITFTNIDGTNYLEYIAGGVATSVDSASFATSASYAVSASYAPFTVPTLQQVTSAGASTNDKITVSGGSIAEVKIQPDSPAGIVMTSIDDSSQMRIDFEDSSQVNTAQILFSPSTGNFTITSPGLMQIQSNYYPGTDGTVGQAMVTDGSGQLSFSSTVPTASFAVTASYAQNAANIFPYTGAARITGSLSITGSVADSNVVSNYTDTFTSSDPISQIVTCTQAEYNSVSGSANASRTLYVITDATGGGQYVSGSLTSNVNALTITSNTASLNCQAGNFFTLTLAGGANTLVNPTNIQAGQTINLRITQSTPTTGSISFPSSVKQVSGSAYVPTAVASGVDIVTFVAFDTSSLYLANVKNFV